MFNHSPYKSGNRGSVEELTKSGISDLARVKLDDFFTTNSAQPL